MWGFYRTSVGPQCSKEFFGYRDFCGCLVHKCSKTYAIVKSFIQNLLDRKKKKDKWHCQMDVPVTSSGWTRGVGWSTLTMHSFAVVFELCLIRFSLNAPRLHQVSERWKLLNILEYSLLKNGWRSKQAQGLIQFKVLCYAFQGLAVNKIVIFFMKANAPWSSCLLCKWLLIAFLCECWRWFN